jgi:hypothetical protein
MANGANPVQTLSADEFEKLRQSLKRINRKAQRVQTSTLEELKLRELFQKFTLVAGHVRSLRRAAGSQGAALDRSMLDRDWTSCRFSEIPSVRGFIPKGEVTPGIEPVAQAELKALMEKVPKLGNEIAGSNFGQMDQLCDEFQDAIMDAIQECRNVTERELREIYTITENL